MPSRFRENLKRKEHITEIIQAGKAFYNEDGTLARDEQNWTESLCCALQQFAEHTVARSMRTIPDIMKRQPLANNSIRTWTNETRAGSQEIVERIVFVPAKISTDGGLKFYRSRIQGPDINPNAAGGGGNDDDDDDVDHDDDGNGGAFARRGGMSGNGGISPPGSLDLTAIRRARELRFGPQRNTPPMARVQQSARRSSVLPQSATPLKRSSSPNPDSLFMSSIEPIEREFGLSASQRADIEAQEDIEKVKRFEEEELLREVDDYELKIALQQIQDMEDRDCPLPIKRARIG